MKSILTEDPQFFSTLLTMIHTLHLACTHEIAGEMLRHISAMEGALLGPRHPIKLICVAGLRQLNGPLAPIVMTLWVDYVDHYISRLQKYLAISTGRR